MDNLYVAVKAEYVLPNESKRVKKSTATAPTEGEGETAPPATVDGEADTAAPTTTTEGEGEGEDKQELGQKRKSDDVTPAPGKGPKLSLKKRHQETHPNKEDRLCSFVGRGDICPYEGKCQYSHNVFDYLLRKPADLGPECYQFKTFGFCPNGFMCRFGDSHIDKTNGINLKRAEEDGGVIERVNYNLLSKHAQYLLRKKQYETEHPLAGTSSDNKKSISGVPTTTTAATPATEAEEIEGDAAQDAEVEAGPMEGESASTKFENLTPYPVKSFKLVDFTNKVYIAPLTTVGNLPFRRILKEYGADITCGEMAMAANIQNAQASEWALLRKHASEDCFGIQLAGNHPSLMSRVSNILEHETVSDFVDLNCGCPIDVVCSKGAGSSLMNKPQKLCELVKSMADNLPSRSITVKVRTGWDEKHPTTHKLIPFLQTTAPGRLAAIFIHGRSRLQRYHKLANWEYILQCAQAQNPALPRVPIIGNGDIFSWNDWKDHQNMMEENLRGENDGDKEILGLCSCAMLGRGALIKPWLPQELKEQRVIDISASERLDMLKRFCNYGLEHWGSDQQGVNNTRRFLLEWLSFLHRYVPAGLVENGPQRMNQRPPLYFGRSDLETILASTNSNDWIKISEMLLGPVPEGFNFVAKHKSNSYSPDTELTNG